MADPLHNRVKFIDRPCGVGKSSDTYANLSYDKRYLIVVPDLGEVERVIEETNKRGLGFQTPLTMTEYLQGDPDEDISDSDLPYSESKLSHMQALMAEGANIVTTHKLFDMVDMSKVDTSFHHIIIDETFECVTAVAGPKKAAFDKVYVREGYAVVDESGLVRPTDKWVLEADDVDPAVSKKLFLKARAGRLHVSEDGFYVDVVPVQTFLRNQSCTVLTYMSEGSLMAAYLRRHGVEYEVERDAEEDLRFRQGAKQRLILRHLNLDEGKGKGRKHRKALSFGYKAQGSFGRQTQVRFATSIRNHVYRVMKLKPNELIFTMRKDLAYDRRDELSQFVKEARLSTATWVHKSTKGTNKHRYCVGALHMYDLNLNPSVKKYLDFTEEQEIAWRKSELVQWIWRTAIRDGEVVQVSFCSQRTKQAFEDWLGEG